MTLKHRQTCSILTRTCTGIHSNTVGRALLLEIASPGHHFTFMIVWHYKSLKIYILLLLFPVEKEEEKWGSILCRRQRSVTEVSCIIFNPVWSCIRWPFLVCLFTCQTQTYCAFYRARCSYRLTIQTKVRPRVFFFFLLFFSLEPLSDKVTGEKQLFYQYMMYIVYVKVRALRWWSFINSQLEKWNLV